MEKKYHTGDVVATMTLAQLEILKAFDEEYKALSNLIESVASKLRRIHRQTWDECIAGMEFEGVNMKELVERYPLVYDIKTGEIRVSRVIDGD